MQTLYNRTARKVCSLFSRLLWYTTDKNKKRSNTKFKRKSIWNWNTKDYNSDGSSIKNRIWKNTNRPSQ